MKKDSKSSERCYIQLYNNLKSEIIRTGIPNSKFYSIRQVVLKSKININTVLKVFKMLENDGYIYSEKGKGYFIKKHSDFSITQELIPVMESFHYGQTNSEGINFSNGSPPVDYFPRKIYQELIKKAFDVHGATLLGYQDVQGIGSLRSILSDYLETQDIFVDKNDIMITSGTQQSLVIVLKTFGGDSKQTVAISNPTYPNALNLLMGMCKIKTFDLKNNGWDLVDLEKVLKKERIHFVYIMPNFQNPTGVVWSEEKKEKLIKLANEYNFYIIEDDCFSEFYYTKRVSLLKMMDRVGNERVIYIKTYSKLVMPGIGLAYMILPPALMQKAVLTKYSLDHSTSGLNQRVMEYFIVEGHLEKHLKKIKKIFKEKYHKILGLLEEVLEIKIINKSKGGFFLWIQLPADINEEEFYLQCKIKGLSLLPGNIFYFDKRSSGKIRISFITPSLNEIEIGVNIMKDVIKNWKK
ncbi:PLP-dependent aminotransferase family protein [Fusobacterium sp. PH5-44]|uniref:aminotransferase-like domain-containing protein n=1 Tax=unclassified Fusobacterium TaxID=2648384 RepID=UPI003D25CE29